MVKLRHDIDLCRSVVLDRDEFVVRLVQNARVLHVGCADAGFTREKLHDGSLFHARMDEITEYLYGVDIDRDGIHIMEDAGYRNLECVDIGEKEIDIDKVDYIVVGEVLEHLSNPGVLLNAIAKLAYEHDAKVIISVPNAFAMFRIGKLLSGIEHVHEDHVAYYSPTTLRTLLNRFRLRAVTISGYVRLSPRSIVARHMKKFIFRLFGAKIGVLSDGFLVVAAPYSSCRQ